MDKRTDKNTFFVVDGAKYEKLTVLGLIIDVHNHILRDTTPISYIKQGRLWECVCECGTHVLISEYSLSRGRNKSCGCQKYAKTGPRWEMKQKAIELRLKRMELNDRIKRLRYELAKIKITPDEYQIPNRLNECGDELRAAYAEKASVASRYHDNGELKRRFTNPKKIERLNKIGLFSEGKVEELIERTKKARQKLGFPE